MSAFRIEVRVVPRQGILDPQGHAVEGALTSLGFRSVEHVHVGRLITLTLRADSAEAATEAAESMCRQLLANPVTEDFDVRVVETEGSAA